MLCQHSIELPHGPIQLFSSQVNIGQFIIRLQKILIGIDGRFKLGFSFLILFLGKVNQSFEIGNNCNRKF